MRVGAYIDGLNLFYGGRELCGRGRPGWRWLDLRLLCERDAQFMVSYLSLQSDVNVATHLLKEVLGERVDAAIVISNDADLRLPLQLARQAVPVGTVNPSNRATAGDLRGHSHEGAGSHWCAS